jgi:branched-subunit amino acid aminotransferase/4-amino-4-deoxychorismate lyase
MKVIFNNQLLDLEDVGLSQDNRGFKYGDGLFETISFVNGIPRFLDKHLERLFKGMKVLRFKSENLMLTTNSILENLPLIQEENKIGFHGKVRLYVWREGSGLYSPIKGKTNVLMTIEKNNPQLISFSKKAGFSEHIVNYPSQTSPFKTMSALKYVTAGIEKTKRRLDEIIIMDHQGFISETLSSNIFIKTHSTYYTPPISTGCIDGIMRKWIIEALKKNNCSIEEKLVTQKELLKADCVFTSNSMGISHINNIGDSSFSTDKKIEVLISGLG